AHLVVDGEVSRWRDTVHDALRAAPPPPSDPLLAGVVAANTDRGLRFVAVVTPEGYAVASAGAPSRSLPPCRADRRQVFVSGEREATAQRLAQSRPLSSLGEMSAVLAHEIRNPLASLKGHAQLVAEGAASDARLAPRADRVVREATRLERLIDELLTFARTGS